MSNSDGLDAFSFAATDALDSDDLLGDESSARPLVLSAVWKSNTLGIAFMEGTELRFAQVADPDFRLLQACKYQLKPSLIVAPSSSDAAWWDALKAPCLLAPGLAGASDEDGGDAMEDGSGADGRGHTIDGADDGAEDGDGAERGGPRVLALKKRDFSPETATKRLALLRTLKDLPSADLTEKEVLIYLEHQAPREQEQARRALAGLLTYLSRAGDEMGERLVVTALRRFSLESQLFMAPECFVSLGIFADDYHPSAHGGRAKDGFRCGAHPTRRTFHARASAPFLTTALPRVLTQHLVADEPHQVQAGRAHAPHVVCPTDAGPLDAARAAGLHRLPGLRPKRPAPPCAPCGGRQGQGRHQARGVPLARRAPSLRLQRGRADSVVGGQGKGATRLR